MKTMKKTYLKPEAKWVLPVGSEALMEEEFDETASLNVNNGETDEEVNDLDDLLSNEAVSVWEEDI